MPKYKPVDQTQLYAYLVRQGTFGDRFDVMELIESWRQDVEAGEVAIVILNRHAIPSPYIVDLMPI